MNCRNCGMPVGPQQGICSSCGAPVQDTSGTNMNYNPSLPNFNMTPNNNGYVNNGMNDMVYSNTQGSNMNYSNVQEPTNFNLAGGMPNNQQINQNMNNGPTSIIEQANYVDMNANPNMNSVNMNNNMNNGQSNGMYYGNLQLPDDGKKKRFPWVAIAIVLVVIMAIGVFILPHFNKLNVSTYEGDQYALQYNANWKVDKEADDMTLYYSDNNSRIIFNALSTFKALNSSVDSEANKKDLYNQFYNAWSGLEGGELTGGTETFLPLTEDTIYARVDYAITGKVNVGSFYVIISEKNDKVISFMTYCTMDNKDKIDKDVLKMLETVTYKREADSSIYDKFKAGEVKEYSAIGYMNYDIPECWKLDDTRTKSVQYKSYIFNFLDNSTLLDIKAVTPFNSATGTAGTSYESMKATITRSYGAIKSEKQKTFKGKVWYIITTPDYDAGGMSYHNEIYFTMSATNRHLYYIEAYVLNDTSEKKTKYLHDSIEYIINSATLYKVNE